jgi:hypothetical protein
MYVVLHIRIARLGCDPGDDVTKLEGTSPSLDTLISPHLWDPMLTGGRALCDSVRPRAIPMLGGRWVGVLGGTRRKLQSPDRIPRMYVSKDEETSSTAPER